MADGDEKLHEVGEGSDPLFHALVIAGFDLTSEFCGLVSSPPFALLGALECLRGLLYLGLRDIETVLCFLNSHLNVACERP